MRTALLNCYRVLKNTDGLCFGTASKMRLISASGLVLMAGLAASAADVAMTANDAAGTTSYNSAGNWNSGSAPAIGNAYFTTNFVLRTPNPTTSGNNYVFGGDSLSIDPGGRFLAKIGNNASGNTTVGTITVSNLMLNGGMFDQAGSSSDNAQLIVAGNVAVNAASIIGALGGGSGSSSFETLEFLAPVSGTAGLQVSGSAINAGGDTGLVKLSAANPFSGTLTVANNTIASTVNRILQLNNLDALSNATLNLDSAQVSPVSFASEVNTGPFNLGALAGRSAQTLTDTTGAAVTLNVGVNNASTTFSGTLTDYGNLVKVGSGTLILTGTNAYYGTTAISGGSLQLGNGGSSGSLYSGNTLTDDGNLTVNRNNDVVQGVDFSAVAITGSGSFTQAGTGTTTLNVANTYSGATTVNAGKLVVSSTQTGTGPITVADGAKLGIAISGTSQLPPSVLTLGAGAATTLEFDGVTSTSVAPINAGTVSVGGPVTINVTSGAFAAGNNYPLIHWTASGPADASAFALGISPGLTATLTVNNSTLYLNVSAVSDIWTGATDGNWNTTTANWTGHANIFANGDAVLFDNTSYNTYVTVNAAVQPANILFNNDPGHPYNLTSSGAGNIGGNGGLTKINTGTVTLAGGANTYTGVTTISAGTLSVGALANGGAAGDIGAAPADPANLILNGGTLQYTGAGESTDRGATLGAAGGTVEVASGGVMLADNGIITGAGTLTKTGDGTLALSGANTFSGGLTLSAGQVNIDNGGSANDHSAIGVGTLTLGANTVIDNTSGSDVTLAPNNAQVWGGGFTYAGTANGLNLGAGPVSLPATCAVTVNANTLTVGGVISGAAGLTKLGAGTLVLAGANTYGNNGAFDTAVNAGTVVIGNDLAFGSSRLNIADGVTLQSADSSSHVITNNLNFGSAAGGNNIFAGPGNLKFTGSAGNGTSKTLTINNPQTEFSGVLSGNMARTVAGTGILIFSGANTYSQGTTINPGATLQLGTGGTNGSLSASGAISDEGTLIFNRSDALIQGVHFASAPITGAGSVIQQGSGTTTLNAANTYSGATTVNRGELFITPAQQGGGDVRVADGASFGVSASSVSNSATIGNLTLGNGGGTTLDFSYAFTGNPTNAALTANTITINGTCAIRIGGTFDVGTFPVLKYASLSGTFAGTVDGPRGVVAALSNDTANHILYVTVSAVGTGVVWTGTDGVSPDLWDLNTSTNWLIGGLPTVYLENVPPGDAVTFNDQGKGLVLVSNTVSPASMIISNAAVDYTFQGSGQINALGGLTKVGGGAVNLNLPGAFAGSTVLSNGNLNLGASQAFANLSGDSAITAAGGALTVTVNNSLSTTYAGDISGSLGLTKNGPGSLSLGGSNSLTGNVFVTDGSLTLDSGFISANNYCSIGLGGTDHGTLTLTGAGAFVANNDLNVGDVGASAGTLTIQDNARLTVNSFYIASANSAGSTASGTVNQTGGAVKELNSAAGTFSVGGRVESTSIGAVGVYNLSGGSLTAAAGFRVGSAGTGTFNQSGGIVYANGDVNIARLAGSVGTYNLDGGVLCAPRVTSSTSANATFNFNGGVLLAAADNATFVQSLSLANIRNGGAVIDSSNYNVTITQSLQHSSIAGDNAIDGGLTKRGAGTLTLAEAGSYYTGPTVVAAGTLSLSPASVSSLNAVTVNDAALSLALNNGTASYYPAALSLAGAAALNLNYGQLAGPPVTAIAVNGSLGIAGSTTINVFGYGFAAGQQFTLIDYSGTALADLNNFSLGALPIGVSATLSNNVANTSIDLVITGASSLNWIPLLANDGFGKSSFNAAGNWQGGNPPSTGNGYFTRAFTLRSPADKNAYVFNGDVLAIDAGGQILFKGTGGQSITVNNLFLNGGLVVYGVSTSDNLTENLAGAVTLQSGTTSSFAANGSANAAETLNVTAPVSGNGNLKINGISGDLGTIVLAATNTYTGSTTVASGTLLVNGAVGNSTVTVNSGATLGGTGSITGPLTVQTGGRVTPGIPSRGALTATLGTLTAGNTTVNGTVLMRIDRAGVLNSDQLASPSIVVNPGATLTVNNLGSTNLAAGDTFTLFSAPVSGSFGTVSLPVLPQPTLYWTNRLAVDGTIAVVSSVASVATLTSGFDGSTLSLSWPAGQGWMLQWQTNSLDQGLGANWVDVPESTGMSSTNIPVEPTMPTVFFRLAR